MELCKGVQTFPEHLTPLDKLTAPSSPGVPSILLCPILLPLPLYTVTFFIYNQHGISYVRHSDEMFVELTR